MHGWSSRPTMNMWVQYAVCKMSGGLIETRDARARVTYMRARQNVCVTTHVHESPCWKGVENIDHSGWRMVAFGVVREDEGGGEERRKWREVTHQGMEMFGWRIGYDQAHAAVIGCRNFEREALLSLSLSLPRRRNLGMSWRLLLRSRQRSRTCHVLLRYPFCSVLGYYGAKFSRYGPACWVMIESRQIFGSRRGTVASAGALVE